ncbi:hypothetical protein CRUP_023628, partial [Coryphaenoides rupestris]
MCLPPIDPVGQRCYWLSEAGSSWSEAHDACRGSGSGGLAAVDGPQLQRFIRHSFLTKTSVWVWLRDGRPEGSLVVGGTRSGPGSGSGSESSGLCPQMALGTIGGRRRRTRCGEQHASLCEGKVT